MHNGNNYFAYGKRITHLLPLSLRFCFLYAGCIYHPKFQHILFIDIAILHS